MEDTEGDVGCGLPRAAVTSEEAKEKSSLNILYFPPLSSCLWDPVLSSLPFLLPPLHLSFPSLDHPPPNPELVGAVVAEGGEGQRGEREGGRPELFIGTGAAPSISSVWSRRPSIINTLAPPQLCFS